MDSSDWARLLAEIRAESDRVAHIRQQWSLLRHTPGWAGPTEQAAWAQVRQATEALQEISHTLAQAEDDARRQLHRARRREEAEALV